jgi:transcription elongation factor Elf1
MELGERKRRRAEQPGGGQVSREAMGACPRCGAQDLLITMERDVLEAKVRCRSCGIAAMAGTPDEALGVLVRLAAREQKTGSRMIDRRSLRAVPGPICPVCGNDNLEAGVWNRASSGELLNYYYVKCNTCGIQGIGKNRESAAQQLNLLGQQVDLLDEGCPECGARELSLKLSDNQGPGSCGIKCRACDREINAATPDKAMELFFLQTPGSTVAKMVQQDNSLFQDFEPEDKGDAGGEDSWQEVAQLYRALLQEEVARVVEKKPTKDNLVVRFPEQYGCLSCGQRDLELELRITSFREDTPQYLYTVRCRACGIWREGRDYRAVVEQWVNGMVRASQAGRRDRAERAARARVEPELSAAEAEAGKLYSALLQQECLRLMLRQDRNLRRGEPIEVDIPRSCGCLACESRNLVLSVRPSYLNSRTSVYSIVCQSCGIRRAEEDLVNMIQTLTRDMILSGRKRRRQKFNIAGVEITEVNLGESSALPSDLRARAQYLGLDVDEVLSSIRDVGEVLEPKKSPPPQKGQKIPVSAEALLPAAPLVLDPETRVREVRVQAEAFVLDPEPEEES